MPGKNQETLTNRIRRLRFDDREMTQQVLAVKVGVTRQTIIALEAGKYVALQLLAFRLAAAFDVRDDDVFHYKGAHTNELRVRHRSVYRIRRSSQRSSPNLLITS
jgi:putative transcriptional regulator